MRSLRRNGSEAGFTILELMITIAVFAVVAQGFLLFVRNASKVSVADRLKAEAYEHAVQMLEELRSLVLDDNVEVTVLADPLYNDGRD
jgi:prepilin-type N-terminal cleavage/methylation domain-containing protein